MRPKYAYCFKHNRIWHPLHQEWVQTLQEITTHFDIKLVNTPCNLCLEEPHDKSQAVEKTHAASKRPPRTLNS